MSTSAVPRWHAVLNTRLLDDAQRATTLTGIQKGATNSDLSQIPTIAASLASLAAKGATLAKFVAAVDTSTQELKSNLALRLTARAAFDLELIGLKGLVEGNATNWADITGMGFTLMSSVKPSRTPPDPPAALVVRIGKTHGKARVAVQGNGQLGRFVAEVSADPVGPTTWSPLPGTGKQRQLSGYASGTKLWVRFAQVRFGLQSDWCTPVLVTIP